MERISRKLSYANVTATLALVIAVGGGSYAVAQGIIDGSTIRDESVTGKQVKNRSLAGSDLSTGSLANRNYADGSITTDKVADRSLRSEDFAPDQIPAGPQGPKGDPATVVVGISPAPRQGRVAEGATKSGFLAETTVATTTASRIAAWIAPPKMEVVCRNVNNPFRQPCRSSFAITIDGEPVPGSIESHSYGCCDSAYPVDLGGTFTVCRVCCRLASTRSRPLS